MKKLALIVVGLLVTLCSYSQDYNKVIRASKLEYTNEQNSKEFAEQYYQETFGSKGSDETKTN
jgi:hypothetical protein